MGYRFNRHCKHMAWIEEHGKQAKALANLGGSLAVATKPKAKAKLKPPRDAVVVIVEKMLAVQNMAWYGPATIKKMAAVLRPYLAHPPQPTMQAEAESSAPRLIRMITLDD